jgi:hypothetical protein
VCSSDLEAVDENEDHKGANVKGRYK